MILDIVRYGNPVLRKRCRPVGEVDDDIRELADNMVETMVDAKGVGLAAPQIGIDIRMAIVDVSHDPSCYSYFRVDGEDVALGDWMPLIFINPELELLGEREPYDEGCLSIPELHAEVMRPGEVRASLGLLDGSTVVVEADGLLGRAIQHEVDHLNGVLFVDRLTPVRKLRAKRELKRLQREWTGRR